jgi:hypothetical protein
MGNSQEANNVGQKCLYNNKKIEEKLTNAFFVSGNLFSSKLFSHFLYLVNIRKMGKEN